MWAAGAEVCVVVNDERVVLGLVRKEALDSDPLAPVERIMESGPTTFRPNQSLERIAEYMRKQGNDRVLITTSDGRLLGLLYREDIEHLKDLPAATARAS
jgi:predicted transcriptional regulator